MSTESNIRTRVTLRYLDETVQTLPLRDLTLDRIDDWAPARAFRWHQGQRHFPGFYWSCTSGGHVGYESRHERDCLIVADFDPEVVDIKSQPFLVEMRTGDVVLKNVTDFLFVHRNAAPSLVNVKTSEAMGSAKVREVFTTLERAIAERGWSAIVWTGEDPTYMINLRFLSGFRQRDRIDDDALAAVKACAAPGMSLRAVESAAVDEVPGDQIRPALLHALWARALAVDLTAPLEMSQEVTTCRTCS